MALLNNGIVGLNLRQDSLKSVEKTILVIGQARAGTTMVASLLSEIGIYIGKNFGPVHEDNDLGEYVGKLLEGAVPKDFIEEIRNRNQSFAKWAWKRPDMYLYLNKLLPLFRSPQVVCILRDAVSISRRNEISLNQNPNSQDCITKKLLGTLEEQRKLIEVVETCDVPALLLSYEKIITAPQSFLKVFLEFLGENKDDAKISKMLSIISPNHKGYSLRARAKEYIAEGGHASIVGILDGILHGVISSVTNIDEDSFLELRIDGVVVKRKVRIYSSQDGVLKFQIDLQKDLNKKSHQVSLYATKLNSSFENSPYIWHSLNESLGKEER